MKTKPVNTHYNKDIIAKDVKPFVLEECAISASRVTPGHVINRVCLDRSKEGNLPLI